MARFDFFGEALPDIDLEELKGRLIVLEGTDGVGRSTHIGLLKQWLENNGHAVLDTGMTRSALAGKRRVAAGFALSAYAAQPNQSERVSSGGPIAQQWGRRCAPGT